jgi:hypothetical protein
VISNPYTDVPTEATDAVKFLSDHGILVKETNATGEDIQTFNGDEDFTDGLSRYISRFHAYYGISLKDDFANTVNHDYLYANPDTINKTSADSVRGDEHRLADGDQLLGLFPCRKHGGWRE